MNKIKYIAMDDTDIKHYLPRAKILTYNQLAKVKDIEKLLPHHKSFFILLYPVTDTNSGHWVCMTRYDKTLEYFDSYGLPPDKPLEWGKFKQTTRYLSQLLAKQKLRINYNTIDFQNKRDYAISTCGAFCVFRILTLTEMNLNLEKNNVMLKTLKEANEEKSYDDIVVEFINKR